MNLKGKEIDMFFTNLFNSNTTSYPNGRLFLTKSMIAFLGIPIDIIFEISECHLENKKMLVTGTVSVCEELNTNYAPSKKTINSKTFISIRANKTPVDEILKNIEEDYSFILKERARKTLERIEETSNNLSLIAQSSLDNKSDCNEEVLTFLTLNNITKDKNYTISNLNSFFRANKEALNNYEISLIFLNSVVESQESSRSTYLQREKGINLLDQSIPYINKEALLTFLGKNQKLIFLKRNLAKFLGKDLQHYKFNNFDTSISLRHLGFLRKIKVINNQNLVRLARNDINLIEVDRLIVVGEYIENFNLEKPIEIKEIVNHYSNCFVSNKISSKKWVIEQAENGKLSRQDGGDIFELIDKTRWV